MTTTIQLPKDSSFGKFKTTFPIDRPSQTGTRFPIFLIAILGILFMSQKKKGDKNGKFLVLALVSLFVFYMSNSPTNIPRPRNRYQVDIKKFHNGPKNVNTPFGPMTYYSNSPMPNSVKDTTTFRYSIVVYDTDNLYISASLLKKENALFGDGTVTSVTIEVHTYDKYMPISGTYTITPITINSKKYYVAKIPKSSLSSHVQYLLDQYNSPNTNIVTHGTITYTRTHKSQYLIDNLEENPHVPFRGGFKPDIDGKYEDIIYVPGGVLTRNLVPLDLDNNLFFPSGTPIKQIYFPNQTILYERYYNPSDIFAAEVQYSFYPYKDEMDTIPDGFLITYNPDGILLEFSGNGNPIQNCIDSSCCPTTGVPVFSPISADRHSHTIADGCQTSKIFKNRMLHPVRSNEGERRIFRWFSMASDPNDGALQTTCWYGCLITMIYGTYSVWKGISAQRSVNGMTVSWNNALTDNDVSSISLKLLSDGSSVIIPNISKSTTTYDIPIRTSDIIKKYAVNLIAIKNDGTSQVVAYTTFSV